MTERLVLPDNTVLSNFALTQQSTFDQANASLAAMIAAGYRSPVASLDALLI